MSYPTLVATPQLRAYTPKPAENLDACVERHKGLSSGLVTEVVCGVATRVGYDTPQRARRWKWEWEKKLLVLRKRFFRWI